MTKTKLNPISAHELTLMPPSPKSPQAFGWIRLLNGASDAGYVYLTTPPVEPHLSFDETYIVTSVPMSDLFAVLDILRHERGLQIRFFDPEIAGVEPSVFIEAASPTFAADDRKLSAPDEIALEIARIKPIQ